jgi:hypothetical protein
MVPEWVTRDIVQSFGTEARAELAGDGMVRVRRGQIGTTGSGNISTAPRPITGEVR